MPGASEEVSQKEGQAAERSKGLKRKKIKVEQFPYTLRYKHLDATLTANKLDLEWANITYTNLGPFNYEELIVDTFLEDM